MLRTDEIVASVYDYCLNPTERQLPLSRVLRLIRDENDAMMADLHLTSQLWSVEQTVFTVDPSTEDYTIQGVNIGRPVMVEVEPSAGSRVRRRIRITDVIDQDAISVASPYSYGLDEGLHDRVEEVGFYRDSYGQLKARFSPRPRTQLSLLLWFEPGGEGVTMDAEIPSVGRAASVFCNLLIARVAKRALSGLSHVEPLAKRDTLSSLGETIADYLRQWHDYRRQDNQEDSGGHFEGLDFNSHSSRRWY